jgi:hypothetical protein
MMSCLVESIAEAMKNLPILSTYTGTDGMKYLEDSNLNDVCHLAETIRRVCNLTIDDLSSIQSLSKQQVIEIVELVEHELLSQSSIEPVKRSVVSDPLAIRVKQENQLIEELNKVGNEVLKKCPQIGNSIEDAVMKSLFMWHGCLNIDKVCRLKDAHREEPLERTQVHDWLVSQSNSNPWIRRGFTAARYFRQNQKKLNSYNWIPRDSPYWY